MFREKVDIDRPDSAHTRLICDKCKSQFISCYDIGQEARDNLAFSARESGWKMVNEKYVCRRCVQKMGVKI